MGNLRSGTVPAFGLQCLPDFHIGRYKTGRMKDYPISETTKKIIQALRKGTRSQSDIAREFGVSRQWVSLVKYKQQRRRNRAARRSKSRASVNGLVNSAGLARVHHGSQRGSWRLPRTLAALRRVFHWALFLICLPYKPGGTRLTTYHLASGIPKPDRTVGASASLASSSFASNNRWRYSSGADGDHTRQLAATTIRSDSKLSEALAL